VVLATTRDQPDHHPDEGHRRHQQPGQRARDAQLGVREQHPGDPHLDDRVGDDPTPATEQRAEVDATESDRDQQQRAEREPEEDEIDRPQTFEADLDEQVGDAPDHAHRDEEDQATSAHGEIFYAVRLHMTQPAPSRVPSPLLLAISSLFVATLVASNILAVKIADVGPFSVPAAIVIFPLAYLFGDVLTEVWGYRVARTVIWTGFFANIIVVLFIAAAIAIPADGHYSDQAAYARVLGESPRLVLASLTAYLLGEFLNAFVLARLKVATNGRFLWTRTIGSTLVGQGVDSAVFISLAFGGIQPWSVLIIIIRDVWVVKVLYEVIATPITYALVTALKRMEGVDTYDRDTKFAPIPLASLRARLRGAEQ
jgi:queuosine precursor transporter